MSVSDDQPPSDRRPDEFRLAAEQRAQSSASGVGAAVVEAVFVGDRRAWDCIVSDGSEWHYVRVLSTDTDPFRAHTPEEVAEAIERFAEPLPAGGRLRAVFNANPLHIGADGRVTD